MKARESMQVLSSQQYTNTISDVPILLTASFCKSPKFSAHLFVVKNCRMMWVYQYNFIPQVPAIFV